MYGRDNKVCVLFQMTTLSRPRKLNQMETARPGGIASVGDTLVCSQLATSYPEAPIRFSENYYRKDLGSDVTSQPYVYDSSWNMKRSENTAYGLIQQDLRAPDKLHEPTQFGGNPNYTWNNKLATVYEAKVRGAKFLPLPGEYQLSPGEISRGNQIVRAIETSNLYESTPMSLPSNMYGRQQVVPAPKGMVENLVSNRPHNNEVNTKAYYTFMAPKSGFGTSDRYKKYK
ncbi:MAG: hypothetical protein RLZZ86_103 [Cyanobacteriota bacterium]|jgi:hypothetical protein